MTWPELIMLLITYAGFFYCGRVYEQVRKHKVVTAYPSDPLTYASDGTLASVPAKPEPHQCQSDTVPQPLRPRRQSFSQIKKVLEHDHAAEKSAETVAKNTEVLSPKVVTQ